jgi:hypothetical protein
VLRLFLIVILTLGFSSLWSQTTSPQVLSRADINKILTDSVKKVFRIEFPIARVYKYSDKSGQHYCVLTENVDSIQNGKDTISGKIKAFNLNVRQNRFRKEWELSDFLLEDEKKEGNIWFWIRYCEFTDFDKDLLIEPIIVYGTKADNGFDNGRIKFMIYYKGKKIGIRHQNGVLDFERSTDIDASFYTLPRVLQSSIKKKMLEMQKRDQAIFPAGWEKDMEKERTHIDEL